MEPPKFRIKKVGEEFPEENQETEKAPEDVTADLESINEINEVSNPEEPVLPEKIQCISCEAELEPDTVICIECGTNQASGKGLKTKSKKKKKKKVKFVNGKSKKNWDSWILTIVILALLAYPFHSFIHYMVNSVILPPDQLERDCVSNLIEINKKQKERLRYHCMAHYDKNYKLFKPKSKRQASDPKFIKVYCSGHKVGVTPKGKIISNMKPTGKEEKIPSKYNRTEEKNKNVALGLTLLIWGLIINNGAKLSFLYFAYNDGLFSLFCCLFIPLYSILFWLNNREETGPSFTFMILSGISIVGGIVLTAMNIF